MITVDPTQRYTPVTNLPAGTSLPLEPVGGVQDQVADNFRRVQNRRVDTVLLTKTTLEEAEQDDKALAAVAVDIHNTPTQNAIQRRDDIGVIQEAAAKERNMRSYTDFVLEGMLTANDPRYSPALHQAMTNQQLAAEMIMSRFEEEMEQSGARMVGDWVDYYVARWLPFGLIDDIGMRQEWGGRENALLMMTSSPDEFVKAYSTQLDEIAREGFFTSENYFAIQNEFARALNAGYAPEAAMDRGMALFEVVTLLPAGKAIGTLSRIANTSGTRAANEALEGVEDLAIRTEEGILNDLLPESLSTTAMPYRPAPTQGAVSYIGQENKIVRELSELAAQGHFGSEATPAQITTVAKREADRLRQISSRPDVDHRVVDLGLGRKAVELLFGKMRDGEPFTELASAERFSSILNGRGLSSAVIEKAPGEYVVGVQQRLNLSTAQEAVDLEEPIKMLLWKDVTRALGSTSVRDDLALNTQALIAESGVSLIRQITGPYMKKLESLPAKSKEAVSQIMEDLRDGADAGKRVTYTSAEFRDKFAEYHPDKAKPTERDIEAFAALQTINDATYFIRASNLMDRFVAAGYKAVDLGDASVPAARIERSKIPDNATVRIAATGEEVPVSAVSDESVIWRVASAEDDDLPQFVVNPRGIREIEPTDVLAYNAGGPRTNAGANYYATIGNRAVMSTFSRADVDTAVRELTNIKTRVDELAAQGKKLDNLTDELDDVVKANNTWNPSLEGTAAFVRYVQDKRWNLSRSQKVSFKARNEPIEDTPGMNNPYAGLSYGAYMSVARRRSNDVLPAFGGGETFNYSPVRTIAESMDQAAYEFSFRNYTNRAKTAWVKAQSNEDKLDPNKNLDAYFEVAEARGANKQRLEELRNIIRRRSFYKGQATRRVDNMMQDASEFVFNKTGKMIKPGDPASALLRLGFQSAFGFFNVFQFMLQASWSLAIPWISPMQGSRALALAIPYRITLAAGGETAIKRFAKAANLDEGVVKEMVEYTNKSGRFDTEIDSAEQATAPAMGLSGWEGESFLPSHVRRGVYAASKTAKKGLEHGTYFFRKGENSARLTSQLTAMLEYKAQFPKSSLLTSEAKEWITRRDHQLTLNMTTGSRGWFQDGLMRLPTQWMSHSLRVMESLTTGRTLSKGERVRLGVWMAVSTGLSGWGLSSLADEVSETMGIKPDQNAYVAIKYGMVDGILSWALSGLSDAEIKTAIGPRMAPIAQILDTIRKARDENFLTAIGGPSAEITHALGSNTIKAIGDVLNGRPESAVLDVQRVARGFAGVDNITKGVEIMRHGTYTTRTGTLMPLENMHSTEGFMAAMGLTNFKQAEIYGARSLDFKDSRKVRKFTKELARDFQIAIEHYERGEDAKGDDLSDEIFWRIELSGFSPYDKMKIRSKVLDDTSLNLTMMVINRLRRSRDFEAEALEELM